MSEALCIHFVCMYVFVESKCINFEVSVYVFEMGSCCVAQADGTPHTVWTDLRLELQLPANMPSIGVSFCFCQKQQLTLFSLRICTYFHMYKYSLGSVVGEVNLESSEAIFVVFYPDRHHVVHNT